MAGPQFNLPGRLVVRAHAPWRRAMLVGGLLIACVGALFVAYELGRRKAGFDGLRAVQERAALGAQIESLNGQIQEQRVQLAAAGEAQVSMGRERTEVAATIGDLQAQLARAQQDLQFYRSIANPQAAGNQGALVRVQQFQAIVGNADTRTFLLRLALSRPIHPEGMTNGQLALRIDGERDGKPVTLGLAELTGGRLATLSYSFRYYANLEQSIALPEGFHAARTTIEVRPDRKGVTPYSQIFVWNPEST
jgi:hypothetical protein